MIYIDFYSIPFELIVEILWWLTSFFGFLKFVNLSEYFEGFFTIRSKIVSKKLSSLIIGWAFRISVAQNEDEPVYSLSDLHSRVFIFVDKFFTNRAIFVNIWMEESRRLIQKKEGSKVWVVVGEGHIEEDWESIKRRVVLSMGSFTSAVIWTIHLFHSLESTTLQFTGGF